MIFAYKRHDTTKENHQSTRPRRVFCYYTAQSIVPKMSKPFELPTIITFLAKRIYSTNYR